MTKTKFTNEQKNEVVKKVVKKTAKYYEEAIQKKESSEMEASLGEEFKNI